MIRFTLVFLVVLVIAPSQTKADDALQIIVKTSTVPKAEEDILVGSRVRLIVDVLGRDGWANIPVLPSLDVPGAIVYRPDGQSSRLNDTIQGESYSGQRNEWWIYPRRSGELIIPSIEIEVAVQTFDPKQDARMINETTDTIQARLVMPTGFAGFEEAMVTSGLSAEQTWFGDTGSMKVGEGITRTITRVIDGAPPLVLPPIVFTEVKGATRYVKPSETSIQSNRGELIGTRTDSVTYVFTREGDLQLPPIEMAWFDPQKKRRQTQTLDGLRISVAKLPTTLSPTTESSGSSSRATLIGVIGLLAALFVTAVVVRSSAFDRLRQRCSPPSRCFERSAFKRLQKATASGNVAATSRALRAWIDSVNTNSFLRFELFFDAHLPAGIPTGLQPFYDAMDQGQPRVDLSQLGEATRQARVDALRSNSKSTTSVLPPLNPTWTRS